MNNKLLVSIIVPVYNVELYLERCVKSLLAQTYSNIEIILVDDGSTDNSPALCDELSKKDSRIKVYHKKNSGAAHSRNYGVMKSNGSYITFVDSDDYIDKEYIEYLKGLLEENHSDIACCDMIKTVEDNVDFVNCNKIDIKEIKLSGKETCERMFNDLFMQLITVWGKLYKSEIVQNNLFPKISRHEDEVVSAKYYYWADNIVISNKILYAYYQNEKGLTQTIKKGIDEEALWAFEYRAKFFEEKKEDKLAKLAWERFFFFCILNFSQDKKRYREAIKKNLKRDRLTPRMKKHLYVFLSSPILYKILKK